jgi:hypothetical protein
MELGEQRLAKSAAARTQQFEVRELKLLRSLKAKIFWSGLKLNLGVGLT